MNRDLPTKAPEEDPHLFIWRGSVCRGDVVSLSTDKDNPLVSYVDA